MAHVLVEATTTQVREAIEREPDHDVFTLSMDCTTESIKVGNVIELGLDSETYDAVVTVSIAGHLQLPVDTVASIASAGLMGGKYVRLEPGKEKKFIAADGRFAKTKDFRSLEDQVGEIIFLATGGPK